MLLLKSILGITLVLALVVAACAAGVLYRMFQRTPAKQWRDRVLRLWTFARRQAQAEHAELEGLGIWREERDQALRDQAFAGVLGAISVGELEAYPGIGPATVDKLRLAGFDTLATLRRLPTNIPGLGEKRLTDLERALFDLLRLARDRFRAGGYPGAAHLAAALAALQAEHAEREACGRARLQAADKLVDGLRGFVAEAERVTFWNYLRHLTELPVSPKALNAPLPDVDVTLHAAAERARAALRQRPPAPPAAVRAEPVRRTPAVAQAWSVPAAAPASAVQKADFPLVLMELTVQLAFATARADGRIARNERELIEEHIRRRYAYDPVLFNRARAFCAQYESAAIDLDACLTRITTTCAPRLRRALVELCRQVAEATNDTSKRETAFLEKVAQRLGVPLPEPTLNVGAGFQPAQSDRLETCRHEPAPTNDQHRAALEIAPELPLTADLVRRQYHLLQERYTPEKLQAMGPDFVSMATRKRDAARAAAVALLESFGEKLDAAPPPAPPQDLRHNPDLDALFGA